MGDEDCGGDALGQLLQNQALDITIPHTTPNQWPNAVQELSVTVQSAAEDFPQLETDESYSLSIPATGGSASLKAATVYGALRGLETFSQLVVYDFDAAVY